MTELPEEAEVPEAPEVPEEAEIRELLERGTPRSLAPSDRMERVRERVVRRRQRRTAAAAALAMAGVALAGGLLPGLLQDGRAPSAPTVPGASRGVLPVPESPGATPPPSPKAGLPVLVRLPMPVDLALRIPENWKTAMAKGDPAYAFAGSPGVWLPYGKSCGGRGSEYCTPGKGLATDGVLIAIRTWQVSESEGAPGPLGTVREAADFSKSCRTLNGTRELVVRYGTGRAASEGRPDAYLEARACLSGPSEQRLAEAYAVLGGIIIGKSGTPDRGTDASDGTRAPSSPAGTQHTTKGATK
ncbi:hypothetical protein [Streptomyces sp. NPDC051561]|uniref:hypothetical protein n=1 Tax=Streptomyces sp. NPDC051561 TaxID=3365658 RepID=UPI0037B34096